MRHRRITNVPGQPHFVTFSTHQRRQFLAPERPRFIVLEALQSCLQTHRAHCHGFVVMPNHLHAILTVNPESTIETFLLAWKKTSSYRIKRFFAQELTNYHDLCPADCPIWQARFYDENLEDERAFNNKLDYIHNNPVTAGLVRYAIDWAWSSARFYERQEDVGVNITLSI
jgi:putative transposase